MRGRTLSTLLVGAAAAMGLPLLAGGAAQAATSPPSVTCSGTLAAGTYTNVTAQGGSSCVLSSSDVIKGNVVVQGGSLTMTMGTTVAGNVTAQAATGLSVSGSTINGSMTVQTGAAGDNEVVGNIIGGSLVVQSNKSQFLVESNQVSANLVVQSNIGGGVVFGNTVSGSCALQGNSPAILGMVNSSSSCNTTD